MEANSTNKKTFQLTEDGQLLGELIYKNLFFLEAEIKLANSDIYKIKPVSIFGTSIIVTKNDIDVVNLKMNWRGQLVFTFPDEQELILKAKGMLYDKYVLANKDEEKLIQFNPKFNWRKFQYNYDITYEKKPQGSLLILLGIYASNYFIASMSGGIAAMV